MPGVAKYELYKACHSPEHSTTGGQGALTHCTVSSEHVSLAEHPPLSRSHDGSQNASPVGSNTLHLDPVGHM